MNSFGNQIVDRYKRIVHSAGMAVNDKVLGPLAAFSDRGDAIGGEDARRLRAQANVCAKTAGHLSVQRARDLGASEIDEPIFDWAIAQTRNRHQAYLQGGPLC